MGMLIMTGKVKLINAPFQLAIKSYLMSPCRLDRVQVNQELSYMQQKSTF